jgi:hypothetical protein
MQIYYTKNGQRMLNHNKLTIRQLTGIGAETSEDKYGHVFYHGIGVWSNDHER